MKYLLPGITLIAILAVLALIVSKEEKLGGQTLTDAQFISWDKPNNDAEWAEDTKKENIDIRPNKVLDTMIEMHTSKLQRETEETQKYRDMIAQGQDPVQYLYWEWRENLTQSDFPAEELEAEALKQAQEQYAREMGSVEKLTQSVERMENEKRLRQEGYLIVNDPSETEGELLLGADVPENRIRNVMY